MSPRFYCEVEIDGMLYMFFSEEDCPFHGDYDYCGYQTILFHQKDAKCDFLWRGEKEVKCPLIHEREFYPGEF